MTVAGHAVYVSLRTKASSDRSTGDFDEGAYRVGRRCHGGSGHGYIRPAYADDGVGAGQHAASNSQDDAETDSAAETTADDSASSPYILASSEADAAAKFDLIDAASTQVRPLTAVQYGPCTLYPSIVYLRKSSNHNAVGTKPYTRCSTAVTSIHQDTDLHYAWFIWEPSAGRWPGGNTGQSSFTQRNVAYDCKGQTTTTWSGTTLGTIVYGGKTYYARVYQIAKELDCEA